MEKNKSTTKSISELTGLLYGYQDMTNRKNKALFEAAGALQKIYNLAGAVDGLRAEDLVASKLTFEMLAEKLEGISCIYWKYLKEASIELPEAIKADEASIDEHDDLEEDLPFVTPDDNKEDE